MILDSHNSYPSVGSSVVMTIPHLNHLPLMDISLFLRLSKPITWETLSPKQTHAALYLHVFLLLTEMLVGC